MNKILELKGDFLPDSNHASGGGSSMLADGILTLEHIDNLIFELKNVLNIWDKNAPIDNILIDVKYIKLISKSNRIATIFSFGEKKIDPNDIVVGARFSDEKKFTHIITYYVSKENINRTIYNLEICKQYMNDFYGASLMGREFNKNYSRLENVEKYNNSKTTLRGLLCDCFFVDSFSIPSNNVSNSDRQLVTFYKTEEKISVILSKLKISMNPVDFQIVDEYGSAIISKTKIDEIVSKVPYLVANGTSDLMEELENNQKGKVIEKYIPDPNNEPVIGVIDTPFDDSVYFSKWVEAHNIIPSTKFNSVHGTKVSSLIVDAETLNPMLADDCGRFRVRHFGILDSEHRSSYELMNQIKNIVKNNQDIHVWNLSLGGIEETSKSFVSYEASVLDELQHEYNCLFVVAGTNDRKPMRNIVKRIAPPADSLNSLVVNSVKIDKLPASYTRKGPVLAYFLKPDVSYYGGDFGQELAVCSPSSTCDIFSGTSASAPLVARKLCYLIDVMNFPREIAKALIIHDAAQWSFDKNNEDKYLKGYGVVNKSVFNILETNDDEIRFYISGQTLAYKTYNYKLPVPKNSDNKYPYIGKVTLCYFPKCYRNQGVDYTETELDLRFGRLKPNGEIEKLEGSSGAKKGTLEKELRDISQKWDNSKHKMTQIKNKNEPLKSYLNQDWGIEIIRSERIVKDNSPVNFGMVVTLKSIDGINRFDEFVRLCSLKSWIVHPIDIKNRIEIHDVAKEDINFE